MYFYDSIKAILQVDVYLKQPKILPDRKLLNDSKRNPIY